MPAVDASPAVGQLLHYRPVVSRGVNGADLNESGAHARGAGFYSCRQSSLFFLAG